MMTHHHTKSIYTLALLLSLIGPMAHCLHALPRGVEQKATTQTISLQNGMVLDFANQNVTVQGVSSNVAQVCANVTFMTQGEFALRTPIQNANPQSAALFAAGKGTHIRGTTLNSKGVALANQTSLPLGGFPLEASFFALSPEGQTLPALTIESSLYDVGKPDLGPLQVEGILVGAQSIEAGRAYNNGSASGFSNNVFDFPDYLRQEGAQVPPGMELQIGQVDIQVISINREFSDAEDQARQALGFFERITSN